MVDLDALSDFVVLALPVVLLAFGLVQARRALRTGGLVTHMAQVIADPRAGRRWLVALSVVLGSFLTVGALGATSFFWPASVELIKDVQGVAFVIGAISLAMMMSVTAKPTALTLDEELSLQEQRPDLLAVVHTTTPSPPERRTVGMYVVPEVPTGPAYPRSVEPDPLGRP